MHYVTASGNRVRSEGEKQIRIKTKTGDVRQMTFQVAKVTKPLCSVSKICEKGHTVVFDESGSYVKHKKAGAVIQLKKDRRVYVMDAAILGQMGWVNNNEQQLASAEEQPSSSKRGFQRPANREL